MSLLKPHVAAMKRGFYASLLALSDALNTPAGLRAPREVETVDAVIAGWAAASTRLVKAVDTLASGVFNVDNCSEFSRQALNRDFDSAISGLIGVYADLLRTLHLEPGGASGTLERAARANLEGIAMWLSTLILMLARPDILVACGGARDFNLRLSFPESRQELDEWVIKPTGYDSGHVRAALAVGQQAPATAGSPCVVTNSAAVAIGLGRLPVSLDSSTHEFVSVDPSASRRQHTNETATLAKNKSGSWWSALFWGGLLGLFIADALGDDCDVDCGD